METFAALYVLIIRTLLKIFTNPKCLHCVGFMIHLTFSAFTKKALINRMHILPTKPLYFITSGLCHLHLSEIIKPRTQSQNQSRGLVVDVGVLAKPILSAQLARFGRNNYAIRMLLWPFAFEWRAPLDLFAHTARDHEKRASRAALTQWDKCSAAHLRRTSNFIACQFTTQHTHIQTNIQLQAQREGDRVAEPGKCARLCVAD